MTTDNHINYMYNHHINQHQPQFIIYFFFCTQFSNIIRHILSAFKHTYDLPHNTRSLVLYILIIPVITIFL